MEEFEAAEVTEKVIGAAMQISNVLGTGFLEKVYQNALVYELRKLNLSVGEEVAIEIYYDGFKVGEYRADIIVAQSVIVEVKAAKAIDDVHQAQLLNYLKATGLKVGLVINFGTPRIGIKRLARYGR